MYNEFYLNGKKIISEDEFNKFKWRVSVKIKCTGCDKFYKFSVKNKKYIEKSFVCRSCSTVGNKNPFYGKHHTISSKKKIGGSIHDYSGKNNPMFNRTNYECWVEKYGVEIANQKQKKSNEKNRESNSGEKNGFYGKSHTDEVKNIIKVKNEEYRDENKNLLILKGLSSLKLTDDILLEILNDYKNNPNNQKSIKDKYNVDFRTLKSYWNKRNIITDFQFKKISRSKKFLGNRDLTKLVSKPEKDLFDRLVRVFGKDNVTPCFIIPNTIVVYDMCIFGKILIEYDGYYWHKIRIGKNDKYKNNLAKDSGYILYRVEEDKYRKINLDIEIEKIKSLL